MIPKAVSILFGAVLTVLACWAFGRLALRRVRTPLQRDEFHLLAFLLGAPLLSLTIFLLAMARLVYDATFWILGAGLLAATWRWGARPASKGSPYPRWFWFLYVPFAVCYFIVAMAPEMSPDGSGYHLGVVGTYYRAHAMIPIFTQMYANLSMGVEMLFLMAYAFGRHSAAALVHCAFLLALPLLVVCWGRRRGLENAAAAGALLFFCSPVVGMDGSSAYIDVALAAGIFALFYVLEIWRSSRDPALLPLIGLAAGFGYAMKYTAFLAVPWAGWIVFSDLRRRRESWVKPLAVVALCALVMMLPWVLRNAAWLHNPVSPLFNQWFPNPFVHVSFEQDYSEYMRHYGIENPWSIPIEAAVRGKLACGLLGPVFLLAPIALLAWREPAGRTVLGAALVFLLPYPMNIGTRFLIPALPFAALAMGIALMRWRWLLISLTVAHAVASAPPAVPFYSDPQAWRIAWIPLKQALRIESEDSWLGRRFPSYRMARMVEQATKPGAVIYTLTPFSESYTTREVRTSFQSAEGERLRDALWMAFITDWQPNRKHDFNIPATALRRIRVVQTGSGSKDVWSIHELRVYSGERELPRAPEWRLTASPFPWDIQLAFDNSPITRWKSWERIRAGMWVQADFGKPEQVTRVRLEQSTDQWAVRMRLEGDKGDGRWIRLGGEAAISDLLPVLGLRRMAAEELKRAGVTHLLTTSGDYGYDDYEREAGLWGFERAGQVDDARLYRLK
ncbi:MAG: glycosyltransferase family 39 protein [Bryobacterales bacterium]|nr:glycosyltransferase family 39 protein [Bryobacterales bacterium]